MPKNKADTTQVKIDVSKEDMYRYRVLLGNLGYTQKCRVTELILNDMARLEEDRRLRVQVTEQRYIDR